MTKALSDLIINGARDVAVLATSIGMMGLLATKWKPVASRLGRALKKQFQNVATETNGGEYLIDRINSGTAEIAEVKVELSMVNERLARGDMRFTDMHECVEELKQGQASMEGKLDGIVAALTAVSARN